MKIFKEFFRFSFVGAISNAVLFSMYLVMTWLDFDPKLAMTILYPLGVFQTFYFNQTWTFQSNSLISKSFQRYLFIYALGYMFNLTMLILFVDFLRWPHQWVQGVIILITAMALFLLQKYWIFSNRQA